MNIQNRSDYDEAKKYLKEITWKRDNLKGSDSFTEHMKMQCWLVSKVLLAYRRENNIFDVGDKIRFQDGAALNKSIHIVLDVSNGIVVAPICSFNGRVVIEGSFSIIPPFKPQHATDEEIKAGHAL